MGYIEAKTTRDNHVLVWERDGDKRVIQKYPARYCFYADDPNGEGEYLTMYGDRVKKFEFDNRQDFQDCKQLFESNGVRLFESDVKPIFRTLSENYYNKPAPELHVTFYDIEVDYIKDIPVHEMVYRPYAPINSVAFYHQWKDQYVLIAVPPKGYTGDEEQLRAEASEEVPLPDNIEIILCEHEKELLYHCMAEIQDSDAICGWNSDFFDTPYFAERVKRILGPAFFKRLSFNEAEEGEPPVYQSPRWRTTTGKFGKKQKTLQCFGRITADYQRLFVKYEMVKYPLYSLAFIADTILKDPDTEEPLLPKLEYEGTLASLYENDFPFFVRYNIRDTEILKGLEDHLGYFALANEMYHLSTGTFANVLGTIRLFEQAVVNYCHHELGVVVPDAESPEEFVVGEEDASDESGIAGAYVLPPKVGWHSNVGSIDIESLYPSTIRAVNISPETLRGQFIEAELASDEIAKNSAASLTLEWENGQQETLPAYEWREKFVDAKYAVSGYGTVYDQNTPGIVPTILANWFQMRRENKQLLAEAEKAKDHDKIEYYDKLQYTFKIKLNSAYGALSNRFFRFFDLRMGESVTGTGRKVLRHQCAKANEVMTGEYEVLGDAIVYGDSVSGDTVVETPDGPVQIQDLFTQIDYARNGKEYSNCVTRALTYNPQTHQNEFHNIKYVVRHKVNKAMYRVWIGNTRYIDVTEDHSLIGYANTRSKANGLVRVKPQDIGINNINSLLLCRHIPNMNVNDYGVSAEMYQLIGYIIGDGHVEKNKESGVGLSVGGQDKGEVIDKLIQPLIEQGWFTSYMEMNNGHDLRLCGVKGWRFLRELLYSTGRKQFPDDALSLSTHCIRNVLKGYFSADGFANINKTVGLCSTNYDFITIAHRMLQLIGIASNFWTETTENSFNGIYSGTYTRRLTIYDAVKFGRDVGFIQDRKNSNLRDQYTRNTQHLTEQTGYCLISPTKIERIPTAEYVYDIEVDETHTFYANDLLVHNTDSSYFETWADDTEAAIKVADYVAKIVNGSFPEFMKETFLCNEGFDSVIKSEREVVSDEGIFVDKKRYFLHLADIGGKRVDKIKVMGLDTKKTTLPREIADTLNKFVERLLKREEWDDIAEDIVQLREKIQTTDDIMSIGLPKGINKVEEYTAKVHEEGTRIPGHIAAAIHYNMMLEQYEDRESPPIISGMKIKVFYLTQKYGRFKSIAVPTDIEVVPDWFYDNFTVLREAHVERLVDKPLKNIFKAIDRDVPTRQSMLTDSLLEF